MSRRTVCAFRMQETACSASRGGGGRRGGISGGWWLASGVGGGMAISYRRRRGRCAWSRRGDTNGREAAGGAADSRVPAAAACGGGGARRGWGRSVGWAVQRRATWRMISMGLDAVGEERETCRPAGVVLPIFHFFLLKIEEGIGKFYMSTRSAATPRRTSLCRCQPAWSS
jgi:hypothetical protein